MHHCAIRGRISDNGATRGGSIQHGRPRQLEEMRCQQQGAWLWWTKLSCGIPSQNHSDRQLFHGRFTTAGASKYNTTMTSCLPIDPQVSCKPSQAKPFQISLKIMPPRSPKVLTNSHSWKVFLMARRSQRPRWSRTPPTEDRAVTGPSGARLRLHCLIGCRCRWWCSQMHGGGGPSSSHFRGDCCRCIMLK
jgi:hypothetical protein